MQRIKIFPIIALLLAIGAALFFVYQNAGLQKELAQIQSSQSQLEHELESYQQLVGIDSMLLKGEYTDAIISYETTLEGNPENNTVIPLRIALAEKLIQNERQNFSQVNTSVETVDSLKTSNYQMLAETQKYDSLNFALEKVKVQLSKMRSQLKQKSYGEYIDFKNANGSRMHYVGQVKNGKANGFGIALLDTGGRYEGQWKNNQRSGEGTYYWPDGQYYIGNYVNDKRNGEGTYYWPNGEKYAGQWKDDKRNGSGSFYGTDGDMVTAGVWSEDKLVEAEKPRK